MYEKTNNRVDNGTPINWKIVAINYPGRSKFSQQKNTDNVVLL